jgi:hypothetical protein
MRRKTRKSFQQLVIQNRLEIETNPSELEKIEKKIDNKHSKA